MPSVTITSSASGTATTSTTPAGSATSSSTLQPSNHRRKKPKRRSTGVVNLDVDVSSKKKSEIWKNLKNIDQNCHIVEVFSFLCLVKDQRCNVKLH